MSSGIARMLTALPAACASRMKHSSNDKPTLLDFFTAEQSMTSEDALLDQRLTFLAQIRPGAVIQHSAEQELVNITHTNCGLIHCAGFSAAFSVVSLALATSPAQPLMVASRLLPLRCIASAN